MKDRLRLGQGAAAACHVYCKPQNLPRGALTLTLHWDQIGGMTQPGPSPQTPPTRQFELGDTATNRILFALTLLGVLLPLNALVSHYHGLDFVYYWPHVVALKGPYHIHASTSFYWMEGLLAMAVYLYSFNFIFRVRAFEILGTIAYACALVLPLFYFYFWIYQKIGDAINGFSGPKYWTIFIISAIPFVIIFSAIPLIFSRLED